MSVSEAFAPAERRSYISSDACIVSVGSEIHYLSRFRDLQKLPKATVRFNRTTFPNGPEHAYVGKTRESKEEAGTAVWVGYTVCLVWYIGEK